MFEVLNRIFGKVGPDATTRFAQLRHKAATDPDGFSEKEAKELGKLAADLGIGRTQIEADIAIIARHAALEKSVQAKFKAVDRDCSEHLKEALQPDFQTRFDAAEREYNRMQKLKDGIDQWIKGTFWGAGDQSRIFRESQAKDRAELRTLEAEHQGLISAHIERRY